jgi:hypothetical protein
LKRANQSKIIEAIGYIDSHNNGEEADDDE